MVIQELGLLHFRNYGEAFVRFSHQVNLLIGDNGQGKTNLLEGLYLVTHLESFRTRKIGPAIQTGQGCAFLQGVLLTGDRSWRCRLELGRQGKKVWLDDVSIPRTSEYIQRFFSLLFNADHLYQFRQFPAERRAFFDRYLAFIDPAYLCSAKDMRVVLAQKNKLLKTDPTGDVGVWNHLFIEKGYAMLVKRTEAISRINEALAEVYGPVSGKAGRLRVVYRPSLSGSEADWARALERIEPRERQVGHALIGPHRDDFRLRLEEEGGGAGGGRDDDRFSQGEFRIGFLALLLAMNRCLEAERGFRPVLILDDLFSELDAGVQGTLSAYLGGLANQVFITTTQGGDNVAPAGAAVREIRAGRIH